MNHSASFLTAVFAFALTLTAFDAAHAQFGRALGFGRDPTCTFTHDVKPFASLADVPAAIRDAVGPMAERGGSFNSTDVYVPGMASRRFVLAGQSGERYFVWYQQGGIALFTLVAVYRLPTGATKAEPLAQQNVSSSEVCRAIDALLDAKPPRG